MSSQDFIRHMGYIGKDLGRRKSVWEYLHIDFPLFVAILILLGFGLMVLYSATDGNMAMMGRQITFIIVSLGAMLFWPSWKSAFSSVGRPGCIWAEWRCL